MDTTLPTLNIDDNHTVSQLEGKLDELLYLDNIDGSLPCVFAYEVEDELALGVMGLLSVNDLRHALGELRGRHQDLVGCGKLIKTVSSQMRWQTNLKQLATSCQGMVNLNTGPCATRYTAWRKASRRTHTILCRSSIR